MAAPAINWENLKSTAEDNLAEARKMIGRNMASAGSDTSALNSWTAFMIHLHFLQERLGKYPSTLKVYEVIAAVCNGLRNHCLKLETVISLIKNLDIYLDKLTLLTDTLRQFNCVHCGNKLAPDALHDIVHKMVEEPTDIATDRFSTLTS